MRSGARGRRKMKPLLGTVVVENQGGGGSSLGAAAVARARPDGYTILLGGSSTHVTEAILKKRPLYDPLKDLQPISNLVVAAFALAINPAVPARTLKEFIGYAKSNPGKLSYGHAGVGSLNHLTGELLKSLTGTPDIVQVPYRGSGPATADAISGQVTMVIPGVTGQLIELHRTGKLRILAVTGPARLIAAPEIPTAVEAGFPAMISQQLIGLFGSGRDAAGDYRADFPGNACGHWRPALPAAADRIGFRTRHRFRPG